MLRLKQVELLGFKSFPNKTVIDLDAGVNCIVGPNGSGKSNIGDAIHFAFGSQSGRELRAHRMSALIFAGTAELRPLNLASVTLHFERTAQELAVENDVLLGISGLEAELAEVPEAAALSTPAGSQLAGGYAGNRLTVHKSARLANAPDRTPAIIRQLEELRPGERLSLTRRIFRDGTGGYFINGEAVRLKDIDAFFNRFNLGRNAVFSISQGEVEKKVLETPQELRSWLAEATGVALLLAHKERAQTKLKRTRQNLERLEDIRQSTRELVDDLSGQRTRAEAHLRLKHELRAVELNEIRREVEFSQRQQDTGRATLGELAEQLAAAEQELGALSERQDALREQLKRGEEELAGQADKARSSRERLAQLKQQAAVARQARQAAVDALEQARQDAIQLSGQREELDAQLKQNEEEARHQQAEVDASAELLSSHQQSVAAARGALEAASEQQAELSNEVFELARRESQLKNELATLKRSEEQLAGQLTERDTQLGQLREKLAAQERELSEHQSHAEELATAVGAERDKLDAAGTQQAALAEQITAATTELDGARDRVAELASRRSTIAELAAEQDDAPGGLTALMTDAEVAERLERTTGVSFPAGRRPAFTRLLAHLGDAAAARGDDWQALSTALAGGSGGEVLVLNPAPLPELHTDSLWHELEAAAQLKAALINMLGDVLVAEDWEAAQRLLATEPEISGAVLADGSAYITRRFAWLGAPAAERALKIAQQSDIAHLDEQLRQAGTERTACEERLKALRAEQADAQWRRDEAASRLAAAEERLRQALKLSDRLHLSIEERRSEIKLLTHQTEQLTTSRSKLAETRPELEQQAAECASELAAAEERLTELKAARPELEEALEDARSSCTQAETAAKLARQRLEHLEQEGFNLAERLSNLRSRDAELQERIGGYEREITAQAELAAKSEQQAEELAAGLEELGSAEAKLRQRQATTEGQAADLALELEALRQRTARLEQDKVARQSQHDHAVERVAEWLALLEERYGLTLSQLLADPQVTAPPPGTEFDASEAGRGKLKSKKAELNAALEELGAVNLLAIEQHQTHSQRLAFMDQQAADLERAVEDLHQLVSDLDSQTERHYRASLKRIEQLFNDNYRELFDGGWARLRFEEPDAIIDSGVEIEVQLPGGRRHSLRSLSGGQRSLIFLALFFAVHSVRSPGFCILDEADAALDDANVERFVKLIRQFGREEQFVVITHNKSTMETADKLIGVVGKPKGISNLLSVDIRQARKMVDRGA